MASEYLKWLARNEKPEEKRELTRKEKLLNWWDYHKFHLLIILILALVIGSGVREIVHNLRNQPDYQIAYIGSYNLPTQAVEQLESALAELGEDLNGDGKVLVTVNQYLLDAEEDAYSTSTNAQIQLMADAASFCFLMENPKNFQRNYGMLVYPDGTAPAEDAVVSEELWYTWSDCPVLTELELGTYQLDMLEEYASGDTQQLLSTLYIGRRNFGGDEVEHYDDYAAFWEKLTQGAN